VAGASRPRSKNPDHYTATFGYDDDDEAVPGTASGKCFREAFEKRMRTLPSLPSWPTHDHMLQPFHFCGSRRSMAA
jgi:hypothetical protein